MLCIQGWSRRIEVDAVSYALAGFVVLFVLFNLLPLLRARRARGRAVPELDALLSPGQRRAPRLLVYFWSPRCGMCRGMTPVIDRLAQERDDVLKVNVAESIGLAGQFGVMATPSLAVVERGVIKNLLLGAKSERQIRKLLAS
jgi:thioredoxin 1